MPKPCSFYSTLLRVINHYIFRGTFFITLPLKWYKWKAPAILPHRGSHGKEKEMWLMIICPLMWTEHLALDCTFCGYLVSVLTHWFIKHLRGGIAWWPRLSGNTQQPKSPGPVSCPQALSSLKGVFSYRQPGSWLLPWVSEKFPLILGGKLGCPLPLSIGSDRLAPSGFL